MTLHELTGSPSKLVPVAGEEGEEEAEIPFLGNQTEPSILNFRL